MKQLILKELREQFKVALIGLVILTAMVSLAFIRYGGDLQRTILTGEGVEGFQPLLRDDLLTQAAFFCSLFGLLLGWLQIRAEQHPDLWAFLVHRPVARTLILQGKIAAGLLLYVLGAGLPLLGFVLVAAVPGKVAAPFTWPMALPLCSLFLAGVVHYFAGLLTGLRQARWYASRGIGVGLAVVATASLFIVPEFWQALLIVVTAGTVLALAVWGSFQTGGFFRDQPGAGKLTLTLTSTVAVMVSLGVLFAVLANLLSSRGGYAYSYYQLTRDGNVLRITQHGGGESTVSDPNGQPVLDEKTGLKLSAKDLGSRAPTGLFVTAGAESRTSRALRNRPRFFHPARFFSPWTVELKTLWYLTEGGRLVGYHGITRRQVGELAPSGPPRAGASDDAHFLLPSDYVYSRFKTFAQPGLLASARTAYRVDVEKRELRPFFTATNGDAILGLSNWASPGSRNNNIALILSRTAIRQFNLEDGAKLELPYVPAAPEYPQVTVFWLEPTNTFAVKFDPDYLLNQASGGKLRSHIKWVNADGSVHNTVELPNLPELRRPPNLAEQLAVVLAPLAMPFWSWDEPLRIWNQLRIGLVVLWVWAGWWLGRRNHFPPTAQVAWAVHHLLFGLPGLLAFLAVQEWPARESCRNCKQSRAVDREQCEHCGADFAPPAKTGTEIFEPLGVN